MQTITKDIREKLRPEEILSILKEGNERFVKNARVERDLASQVEQTSVGQYPFAAVLGCIDSRVPAELVFDLGIGDIFNVRVAGNIVNEDVLGSLEYACKVAGAKVILVLGHTKCGAVSAAYSGFELGNITLLLQKIKPAIEKVRLARSDSNADKVAEQNVLESIGRIKRESKILSEMYQNGDISIVGAMYNIDTGKVDFME